MSDAADGNKFDDLSLEVRLERRERSYAYGEPRVRSTHGIVETSDIVVSPDALNQRAKDITGLLKDRIAIRQVVEKFERLAPEQVVASMGKLTLETYTSIADGQMIQVNRNAAQDWSKSAVFKAVVGAAKGKVEFLDFHVTMTDERTATVTYTIAQGGVVGTSSVILIKEKTWRIAVHCQHPIAG